MTWKHFQALNRIQTHDLCVTGAMPYQLSYQSHMRAVYYHGLHMLQPSITSTEYIGSNSHKTALMWLWSTRLVISVFLRTTAKHKLVEGLFRSLLLPEVSQNNFIYYNHHRWKQLRKRNGSWLSDIQLILSVFRRTSYCCWGRIWANHWLSSSYRGSWWMSCSNKDSIRIPSVLSESFEKSFNNPTGKEQLSNCLWIEKSS